MLLTFVPSREEELVAELAKVRDEGLPRLRHLALPALTAAGRAVTLDDASVDHVVVEALLRRVIARFRGGHYGEAALALFGLDVGTRGLTSRARREIAAEAFERTYETFRKNYEPLLFEQLAAQILVLCAEQRTREARGARGLARPRARSRMASIWMDRFAAYYRIWTPVSGLRNDLTAYRSTLLEHDRPWDRRFGSLGPSDEGYSQEEQAEGYARDALYHYAHFEWQLRQFSAQYGGQWLLSDAEAEQAVADAVYRIAWYAPWNERDRSFLRMVMADTPNQELHHFITRLASSDLGRATYFEWTQWTETCECSWEISTSVEPECLATEPLHAGISVHCTVHKVVQACCDYLDLIDRDWKHLADWYHGMHRSGA